MDQIKPNYIIISFDYDEGYYRAIHLSYGYWVTDAVKMKYLGDSSKDFFMRCYIGPNYQTALSGGLLQYFIPCTLNDVSVLNEGTYCVEIVKKLIGDITSEDYCTDYYTFKAIKATNLPSLTVGGFAADQSGCVQPGETVILLATVKNQMSIFQDYGNIGIGLANTEVVTNDISLQCKIEGQKSVGSTDKIICKIPDYISEGYYSILYSSDLIESYECPVNSINEFNSLNFNGQIKKLQIFKGNYGTIGASLLNITFENPLETPGLFKLTFSLNNIQDIHSLTFDNSAIRNIEIKLCDESGILRDNSCNFAMTTEYDSIFYLTCTPESYEKDTRYSLVILSDIVIGYDPSIALCTYGGNTVYQKVKIYSAEYDFLIVYDENNSPYLDCNLNNTGYYGYEIKRVKNYCGSCNLNCVICKNSYYSYMCYKCLEGFTLKTTNECAIKKDKINFNNFQGFDIFLPNEESCEISDYNNQLFSLKYSYVIYKGENLAIESEEYNNIIYAKSDSKTYGLKCVVDVNPDYIPSNEAHFGNCKKSICYLIAYVNCSTYEQIANGLYNIQTNYNDDFSYLINRAKSVFSPIEIKFICNILDAVNLQNSIIVFYKGLTSNSQTFYLCPYMSSYYYDCYTMKNCRLISNESSEESVYDCKKELDNYYERDCQSIKKIMIRDNYGNILNKKFEFEYCPFSDSYYSSSFYYGNLYILLIILLIII